MRQCSSVYVFTVFLDKQHILVGRYDGNTETLYTYVDNKDLWIGRHFAEGISSSHITKSVRHHDSSPISRKESLELG